MELRRYWQIIRRYWPVVVVLALIGVVAAFQYYTSNKPTYQATAIVNITQQPTPGDPYSNLYANQAGDFATDELVKIIQGNVFLTAVSTQLKEGSIIISPDELKGMLAPPEPKNRTITITVNNSDQNAALKIAQTIANTLQNSAAEYLQPRQVLVKVIDFPQQSNLSGGRTVLLAVVRVLAGVLAGIALAFLLAYLDNSIRNKNELEELLGVPVMGLIPLGSKLEATRVTQTVHPREDTVINARLNSMQRPATGGTVPAVQTVPAAAPYVPDQPVVQHPAPYVPDPPPPGTDSITRPQTFPAAAQPEAARPQTFPAIPHPEVRRTETFPAAAQPEAAGTGPTKPKRVSRARKDPATAGGKEELPTL